MGRYALLVATSEYFAPGLRDLHTVEEAEELRRLLADQELGAFDTAHTVLNGTKAEIERRVESLFQNKDPDDLVLLYLAGHGITNDDDQLFFAATDTEPQLPYSTAVPAQVVDRIVTESQAGWKAIFLDCCYSGVFNHGAAHRGGEPVNVVEHFGGGRFTMTATNEIEYSYERRPAADVRPGSRFTAAIIEAITSGAPDVDGDGVMTFNELYSFVHQEVTKDGRQTPTRSGTQHGDMMFSRVRGARFLRPGRTPLRIGELLDERAEDGPPTMPVPLGRAHEVNRGPGRVMGLDLFGGSGHVAVVGRIQSGKSTLLHTLVLGLTATFGADQLQFKCLDADGGIAALPQVSAADHTEESVAELLAQVEARIDERRKLFANGIGTIDRYRRLRRERPDALPDADHSETFLFIDGWSWFAGWVPGLAAAVVRIAEGLKFGVHVLVTARRWSELPEQLLELVPGRVELSLAEPSESLLDPELSASLPATGWALHAGRAFQVAQPKLDDVADEDITELVASISTGTDLPPAPPPAAARPGTPPGLFPLLARSDVTAFDPAVDWQPGPVSRRYRAVLGSGEDGTAVLDLKETALGGAGPHGLCVGAPGSGRSELLRTAVLSLLATHSPEELNVVLVEAVGGTAFADFQDAPHVSALITDLAGDPELVDRLHDALSGEIHHRQTRLNEVRTRTVWEYRELRLKQPLPPLPMLFVVVDGFTELLRVRPVLAELFQTIVRVGRSLQVQLLLAGESATEPGLRGLADDLTYRIALRTGSAAESSAAIDSPDAAELPAGGGHGYLRHPTGLVRFRTAHVSDPVHGDRRPDAPSELQFAVRRMRGTGPAARRIWVPPLRRPPALEQLLPPPAERLRGRRLHAPIGTLDLPFEHQQRTVRVDLSGGSGHVAIVGAPGSGKSVAVRTLLLSLALTHSPQEVQFYCLDLDGGGLHDLRELPHVGAVSGPGDPDVLRRTIAQLRSLLAWREARFIEHGIDSIAGYRARRRDGGAEDDDQYGDVFLIIDGWPALQGEFDGADRDVVNLASQGWEFGLHVVVTADRWSEIRPALKDLLGTRLELRLADPAESEVSPEAAARVPADLPGRGLHPSKLHMFTALPHPVGEGSAAAVAALRARTRDTWPGVRAPRVRLLPLVLQYDRLPAPEQQPRPSLVPIGVNEEGMDPVYLDFRAEPHFYAFGELGSGRTSLLRTVLRGITTRYSPQEAAVVLVDLRRALLGFLRTEHLAEHAVNVDQVRAAVRELVATLRARRPAPDLTREQLRDRSWWSGPELFVVVDDYELLSAPDENPLAPLAEFVAQSAELGLHLVLAREASGAREDWDDPLLVALRAAAAPGLLLSADEAEGELIGRVAATRLPPGRGTLVSRASRGGPQLVQTAHIRAE